jgi:hypothetical protein
LRTSSSFVTSRRPHRSFARLRNYADLSTDL